jgi:mono/diheme cytochrome c family protein
MKLLKLGTILAATALFLMAACDKSSPAVNTSNSPVASKAGNAATPSQPTKTVAAASDGKELYALNCMICHKDTGKGGPVTIKGKNLKPADLTSDKLKKHSDDKLFEHISEGVPDEGMPSFNEKLTDDQIKAVVAYVRTLQMPNN